MKKWMLLIGLLILNIVASAQFPGSINVTILDEKGYPANNVTIQLIEGEFIKSDMGIYGYKGAYLIKPVFAGRYRIRESLAGYRDFILTGILVSPQKTTEVNISLEAGDGATVKAYKIQLVDKYQTIRNTSEEITEKFVLRSANDMVSIAGGTYQSEPDKVVSKHKSPFKRFFNWLRNL